METVFLGLGSNLGDREGYLRRALDAVAAWAGVELKAVSSLYETDPVGPQDQGRFLNAVAELDVSAEPESFLDDLLALELRLGRVREGRWGPRVIDLDLLLWGQRVINKETLVIPHPEMANRGFVLIPLAEIAPGAIHPVLGSSAAELAARVSTRGVRVFSKGGGWSNTSA